MGPLPLGAHDPQSVGPYELLARLGAGGMGQVYLARGPAGRPAAVKVVRDDYAKEHDFRPRFRAEVAAARAVSSPFVVPLIDADPEAELPWLATEYVRGTALRELVVGCGPLPEQAVRLLGAGLAEALAAIHSTGLSHRDLTPANVLLTREGPRVIDFGIARAAGAPELTRTGAVIGTPGYIPPEQAAGFRAGPAGDVFALGSVLVLAATGSGPFGPSTTLPRMLARVLATPSLGRGPDLRAVPQGLRPLLAAALARDPADRPTARELREQLLPGLESLTYGPSWLPAPVIAALERQLAEVDGFLPTESRWSRRALLLTGAAVTVAAAGRVGDPCRTPGHPGHRLPECWRSAGGSTQ